MSGLQGSGKTTLSGKLAVFLKSKKQKHPLLVACDVYRPAAINQLKVLGEQIDVPVFSEEGNMNPVDIAKKGIAFAKENHQNVVIIDTAGRLAIDEEMMNEIANIRKAINPNEILFVVDAMTGQDAVNTAKAFNERLDFSGVVLTKLDGDTRGGAALSIKSVVNEPIKFVGTGEKLDALDIFYLSVWQTAFLVWVTLLHSSKKHRNNLMKWKLPVFTKRWRRTSLPSLIFSASCSR